MRKIVKPRHAKINFLNPESPPTEPDGYTGVTFVRDALGNIRAMVPEGGGGGDHASTHYDGGGDEVDIKQLGGYPGGTSTFLRGDKSFATPPSAGNWALIHTWQHSVSGDTANVDVDDLDYDEIFVAARLVTLSVSGRIHMRVSTDNGSTFYSLSSDYVQIDANGVESGIVVFSFTHNTNATAARSGTMWARFLNQSGVIKIAESKVNSTSPVIYFIGSTNPVDAIRIFNNAGGNFTGGRIDVWAR